MNEEFKTINVEFEGYTIVMKIREDEAHYFYFQVFERFGDILTKNGSFPSWSKWDDEGLRETDCPLSEAKCFIDGCLRASGCMDFTFPDQKECATHFCGNSDAKRLGLLIDKIYDLGRESLMNWCGE